MVQRQAQVNDRTISGKIDADNDLYVTAVEERGAASSSPFIGLPEE